MTHRIRSVFSMAYGACARLGKVAALIVMGTPVMAQDITIAALGDSLTAGYGLAQHEGLVPQLEAWLQERGQDVRVINAGVSGDTTAGGLARAAWTLTSEVDAMIVALGGNDFLRGIDPAASRANLAGILEAAGDLPVLLVGIVASNQYGPDYRDAFNAMYPALAQEHGTLLEQDFFNGFRAPVDAGASVADFMQRDGIHPNADGVALVVDALGPQVLTLIAQVPAQ